MTASPNRLKRFWKELKRRRVVHVITVYASAAFVIIELVNNLAEPLRLPSSFPTVVIIVLAVGFPLAVILGWIYDLTPEGIEKTRPTEDSGGEESKPVPNTWRIATYVSFVVIAGLIVLNIVRGTGTLRAGDIQSIAILPFDNFTGDDQLENMVSSMHSLMIGDMGRIGELRVTGKFSSYIYKGAAKSAREIARELDVDAVLEGTFTCLGDTVCMQFRLLNVKGKEYQLWAADYLEDKGQILNVFNRVTKQIAEEVRVDLTEQEQQILDKDRSGDREAMDAYIRSYKFWGDLGSEALDEAERYLNLALEEDPEWAPLHSAMAGLWGARMQMGQVDLETGRQKMYEYLNRADELDPEFPGSHVQKAGVGIWSEWNWEKGEKEYLQGLAINPNHVIARIYYAHLLMILQRIDEALVQAKLALKLDPMNPTVLALYSVVLKGAGQHEAVLQYLEKALSIDPEHSFTHGQLERAYYNLGDYNSSLELLQQNLNRLLGEESVPDLVSFYNESGRLAAYREVARLWELYASEHAVNPTGMAMNYYRAEMYEKAIDEMEKAYAMHEPNLPYIGTGTRYEALHQNSRFLAILDRMNLPHPR